MMDAGAAGFFLRKPARRRVNPERSAGKGAGGGGRRAGKPRGGRSSRGSEHAGDRGAAVRQGRYSRVQMLFIGLLPCWGLCVTLIRTVWPLPTLMRSQAH
jgi:hypothetical protein